MYNFLFVQLFEKQLIEIAVELGIDIDGMHFIPSNWNRHYIAFYYDSGGIVFGIVRKKEDKKKSRLLEIEMLMNESFKVSNWMPMWQYFYKNIDTDYHFWEDIINGNAKKKAKDFVKIVNENFNKSNY